MFLNSQKRYFFLKMEGIWEQIAYCFSNSLFFEHFLSNINIFDESDSLFNFLRYGFLFWLFWIFFEWKRVISLPEFFILVFEIEKYFFRTLIVHFSDSELLLISMPISNEVRDSLFLKDDLATCIEYLVLVDLNVFLPECNFIKKNFLFVLELNILDKNRAINNLPKCLALLFCLWYSLCPLPEFGIQRV